MILSTRPNKRMRGGHGQDWARATASPTKSVVIKGASQFFLSFSRSASRLPGMQKWFGMSERSGRNSSGPWKPYLPGGVEGERE